MKSNIAVSGFDGYFITSLADMLTYFKEQQQFVTLKNEVALGQESPVRLEVRWQESWEVKVI